MVRKRKVLLHFVEPALQNGVEWILLPVYGFRLQSREEFCERHGHRISAKRLEAVDERIVLHHTQFDALHVFHFGDFTLGIGHVAKAIFLINKADQTLNLKPFR